VPHLLIVWLAGRIRRLFLSEILKPIDMRFRQILFFFTLVLGMFVLMSGSCNKNETEDPSGSCTGYVTATATGAFTSNLCFDVLVSYSYVPGESLNFVTRQDGEPTYSCTIQLNSGNGSFNGPGTYACGFDEVAYVELDIHGTDNEYYKAKSGTITITQIDEAHLSATFNVVTEGYYNAKSLNFSGTVKK